MKQRTIWLSIGIFLLIVGTIFSNVATGIFGLYSVVDSARSVASFTIVNPVRIAIVDVTGGQHSIASVVDTLPGIGYLEAVARGIYDWTDPINVNYRWQTNVNWPGIGGCIAFVGILCALTALMLYLHEKRNSEQRWYRTWWGVWLTLTASVATLFLVVVWTSVAAFVISDKNLLDYGDGFFFGIIILELAALIATTFWLSKRDVKRPLKSKKS